MRNLKYDENDKESRINLAKELNSAYAGERMTINGTEVLVTADDLDNPGCNHCFFADKLCVYIHCVRFPDDNVTFKVVSTAADSTTNNAKKMIANEIMTLLGIGILEGEGAVSFDKWTQGGEAYNADYKYWSYITSPLTEQDIKSARELSAEISDDITRLIQKLAIK